jgi:hypothetical protein
MYQTNSVRFSFFVSFAVIALFAGMFFVLSASHAYADDEVVVAPVETVVEVPLVVVEDPAPVADPAPVVEPEVVVIEEPAPAVEPEVVVEETPAVEEVVVDTSTLPASVISTYNPTLTTDQADYAPGSLATIFGRFFQSFQNVLLTIIGVNEDNSTATQSTWSVLADDVGSFITSYQLPDFYVPLYLLAANSQTGEVLAETTFTDSPHIASITVGSQVGALTYGTAGSVTFVTTPVRGTNGTTNGTMSVTGLPTGVTASFSSSGTWTSTGGVAFPSFTLTLTSVTSALPGTYTITVKGADGTDLATNTISLLISKKTITASVTASNKGYDGTTAATIATCTPNSLVGADVVTCSAGGPNTFTDKNFGVGKTVTATGITLGGRELHALAHNRYRICKHR